MDIHIKQLIFIFQWEDTESFFLEKKPQNNKKNDGRTIASIVLTGSDINNVITSLSL